MFKKIFKYILVLGFLSVFLGLTSIIALKVLQPYYYYKLKRHAINWVYPPLESPCKTKIKRDTYKLHVRVAKSNGIPLLLTNKGISNSINNGGLIKIKKSSGFKINKLEFSKPYLSKKASLILTEIGQLFYNKTKGQAFTVTSFTRSVASQKKLIKSNGNATKNTSSHSYGASFDISYIRFNGKRRVNCELQSELESTLTSMQKQGKIYLIYEKRNRCYHVTVR